MNLRYFTGHFTIPPTHLAIVCEYRLSCTDGYKTAVLVQKGISPALKMCQLYDRTSCIT